MKKLLFLLMFIPIVGFAQTSQPDTVITGVDTISAPTFRGIFGEIDVTIRDTSGGAVVDSFYVQSYDPYQGWYRIGARNKFTWATDTVLVPGDGHTNGWVVYDFSQYAPYVRVVKMNKVFVDSAYSYITWIGKK